MGDLSLETTLQESLEAEFCPPLDGTLVALLVADHISGSKPSEEILMTLRDQLTQLALGAAADQDDLARDVHDLRLSSSAAPSATEDSQDVDSVFSRTGLDGSSSSASSSTPPHEMVSASHLDSAIAFLQTLFPRLSLNHLSVHLEASQFDMESAVEDLLSEEYVKELEERGLEDETLNEEKEEWSIVSKKSRTASRTTVTPKKRKLKGTTTALNDVRQKHHDHSDPQGPYSAGDPWSQVASLSSYLETLLCRPSPFFQSYFHNPEYPSPAAALRASLRSIKEQVDVKQDQPSVTTLSTLLEFVRASPEFYFDTLDTEEQERICADAELVLSATPGAAADASLDVLKLLHEIEVDGASGREMGVYHSPISSLPLPASKFIVSQSALSGEILKAAGSLPTSPISSGANTRGVPAKATSTASKRLSLPVAPTQSAWQTVPIRRKPPEIHPLAAHIPAYDPHNVPRRKSRPLHSSVSKPTSSTTTTSTSIGTSVANASRSKLVLGGYKTRIAECHARRDEALRTASRHWNAGGGRNRGGEVALFYAQEAQRHRDEAHRLQLDALRQLIDEKRNTDADTIDVHHCTTAEALTIVREVLDEGWCSVSRPLRIITGRGSHSSGGVAVLGPAVTKALEQDGWAVGKWDGGGGISVRGRMK